MANLYIMCGVPGAGKSTFLKNHVKNAVIVSRDEIRFSKLLPNEEYFSHEKTVYKDFCDIINKHLAEGRDVFADQTSLTVGSRKKLLDSIKGYNHVNIVWIDENLEICLERNEYRKGTRSYVPREVIKKMFNSLEEPTLNEGFYRIFHYNSKEDKIIYKGEKIK